MNISVNTWAGIYVNITMGIISCTAAVYTVAARVVSEHTHNKTGMAS